MRSEKDMRAKPGSEEYILTGIEMPYMGDTSRTIIYNMYGSDPGMIYYTISPKQPKPITIPATVPASDTDFATRLGYGVLGILAGAGAAALTADNVTGVGVLDDPAMAYLSALMVEYFGKACGAY